MKKNLSSFLSLLMALALFFSLAGCSVSPEDLSAAAEIAEDVLEIIEQLPQATEETSASAEETADAATETSTETEETQASLDPYGSYTSKEDVALYIHLYGELPFNFMTKKEARALGWEGGSLEPVAPGMSIGGDWFGNYEGLLPENREYTECDIDTLGKSSRGAKRIVFSDDGLIYYTEDHYESFELLYGEP